MQNHRCEIFLSFVGEPGFEAAATEELEQALREVIESAHARWPGVTVTVETYFRHLADHLPKGGDLVRSLGTLHTDDLFLAAACLAGDPRALEAFDEELLSDATPAALTMGLAPDAVEEAKQVLRLRFFVGDSGRAPKLLEYSGTGRLRGWVRAAVVRAALRVVRQPKGRRDTDSATLGSLAAPSNDLELDYMKRLYGAQADEAVRESFAALTPRDRNLLRQYFGLGLTIDEIAAFYLVHRATAARWVAKARDSIAERSREGLARRIHVAHEDVSSVVRLLRSQLEERLRNLIATPAEATTD